MVKCVCASAVIIHSRRFISVKKCHHSISNHVTKLCLSVCMCKASSLFTLFQVNWFGGRIFVQVWDLVTAGLLTNSGLACGIVSGQSSEAETNTSDNSCKSLWHNQCWSTSILGSSLTSRYYHSDLVCGTYTTIPKGLHSTSSLQISCPLYVPWCLPMYEPWSLATLDTSITLINSFDHDVLVQLDGYVVMCSHVLSSCCVPVMYWWIYVCIYAHVCIYVILCTCYVCIVQNCIGSGSRHL